MATIEDGGTCVLATFQIATVPRTSWQPVPAAAGTASHDEVRMIESTIENSGPETKPTGGRGVAYFVGGWVKRGTLVDFARRFTGERKSIFFRHD